MKKLFLLALALVCAGSLQALFDRDRGGYYDEEGYYEGGHRGLVGSVVGGAVDTAEDVADVAVGDYDDDRNYSGRGYRRDGGYHRDGRRRLLD